MQKVDILNTPVFSSTPEENVLFCDFGKHAFAVLEIEGECDTATEVTLSVGEVKTCGRINRAPGGSRIYQEQTVSLSSGKNLVKMMIEGQGFACIDLGVDVDAQTVVNTVRDNDVQLVCLSALLTTTMSGQKDVIDALGEAGLRDKVRVMVGGAPVTESFCEEIGADRYTSDAASAADAAVELCNN